MSNSWIQVITSGLLAGAIYAVASYQYRKRGLDWSRRQAAEVRAITEKVAADAGRSRALAEESEALHERAFELLQELQAMTDQAKRIACFNIFLLGSSSYLSSSQHLEIILTRREPDAEACRSRYAAVEDDRRIVSGDYETARSSAIAGPNAESEVAALDAVESAASTLHDLVVDWYTSLEDAGWPTGQSSPEGIGPARQTLFLAAGALSHIADRFGPSAESPASTSAA